MRATHAFLKAIAMPDEANFDPVHCDSDVMRNKGDRRRSLGDAGHCEEIGHIALMEIATVQGSHLQYLELGEEITACNQWFAVSGAAMNIATAGVEKYNEKRATPANTAVAARRQPSSR